MARFEIVHLPDVAPAPCPCGQARRAFVDSDPPVASMHLVDIKKEMRRFLAKHGVGFERWWSNKSINDREDWIIKEYPMLYYSAEDRWSYKDSPFKYFLIF